MAPYTRQKRRLAGPAFNTRSGAIRQPVERQQRLSRQQLFHFARTQLAYARTLKGTDRDAAFEELFLQLWTHKRLLTRTWLAAYIRIAAAYAEIPACAAFLLLTTVGA